MKTCKHCGADKPLTEFYAQSTTRDRRMNICKTCHKNKMRGRYNLPHVKEYERARARTAKRKELGKRVQREWHRKHPEATRRHRAEHPEIYRARTAVGNAVRDGRLVRRSCAICDATENIHGHHNDYSSPLDVIWLCARCHYRLHKTFPQLSAIRRSDYYVANLGPNNKRIAQLLRMLGSSGGERRNAFTALEGIMQREGISWSDIGNAIEHNKYTEEEMQEFFRQWRIQQSRNAGVRPSCPCGGGRGRNQDRSSACAAEQWSSRTAVAFGDGGAL